MNKKKAYSYLGNKNVHLLGKFMQITEKHIEIFKILLGSDKLHSRRTIAKRLSITPPSVSKHMKLLEYEGIVKAKLDQRTKLYKINPIFLKEVKIIVATYEKGNTSETYNIHKCKLIAKTNITRKSYLNYMKRDGWKLSKRQYNKSLISYFPEGTAVIDWPHDKIESKIILYINAVVGDSPDLLYLILDKARRMKERLETKYPKLKISNDLSDLHLIRDFHISSIIDPFAIHSYALGINKQCKEVEASWLSEWEEKGMSAEDNMNAIYKMRQLIKLHNITELELADIIDKHLQSVSDKKTECLHNINRDASATSETLREKSKKRVIVVPKIHADQNSKKEQSASESSNVNIKLNIDITITT